MQADTQVVCGGANARAQIGKGDRRQAMAWPHMKQPKLVERFNSLGPERLAKVLLFERNGDPTSQVEGVWVLIADGDQRAGIGVLLSNVISLEGHLPRRGDLVE